MGNVVIFMEISSFLYEIGKWSGITGFTMLSFLIFSGDTARFWDKFFGIDKIIKFQRKFSYITTVFVLFHPLFFILSKKITLKYLIPDFSIIPLAFGNISLYIFFVVIIASAMYKRISYIAWQYIHILIYILFLFSIYHAFKWGSDSNDWRILALYIVSSITVFTGMIYRTRYKIKNRYSSKSFVKNIHFETKDTFTLTIQQHRKMKFIAGQFCFLRLNKNRLHARHPFTISSPPNDEDLQFTIKNTGKFTRIASELKVGDEIIVDGPFGIFTKQNNKKDLVLIAGGVGITPFISMIEDNLHNNIEQNIILIYGSKTKDDIIFRDRLEAINQKWFNKVYLLSKEKNTEEKDRKYEYGYITENTLQTHIKDIDNSIFYICGPKQMKNNVIDILNSLGVKKRFIFVEEFFW